MANPSFRVRVDWEPRLNKRGELVPARHGLPVPFLYEFTDNLLRVLALHFDPATSDDWPGHVAPHPLKLIAYDYENEVAEFETSGERFFDTLASLLDAVEQLGSGRLPLEQKAAYALSRALQNLPRVEISLRWRGKERSVVIDKAVLERLRALIVKEHQTRQYISVREGPYWRRRIFVNVANESALPELRRELEDRGMVCFELDGTRISDFWSFGQEAARVGIVDEDDWEANFSTIAPHRSAILWRHADHLFDFDPVGLINAVQSILQSGAWRRAGQVELFLLGEGRLVEPQPDDVRPEPTAEEQAHETARNLMFALGFNTHMLKANGLWTPELQQLNDAYDADLARADPGEEATRKSLAKLFGQMEALLQEHDIPHISPIDILEPSSD